MANRYEETSNTYTEKDPHKGIVTTYSRVDVTILDTSTGKSATGTGHALHGSPGAREEATQRAHEDAVKKLSR
jgi:hypothetical protein